MNEELNDFTATVRSNCDISDAGSVGLYSICGLALRLRDLYKWEHGLPPWVEKDSSQILDWIDKKEHLWEAIADHEFKQLSLFGKKYDPFDTASINPILSSHGLFYGAGYAHSLKPAFFLARIKETQTINGVNVVILAKELARDLLTIPALHQDQSILIRQQAARLFLWDQMAYLTKSGRPALHFALKHSGLPDHKPETRKKYLESILSVQQQTYIHHEIGELKETSFNNTIWRKIISQFAHTPVELLARAAKDLLADTHPQGTLDHIIRKKDKAGLGFYAAFIDGMVRVLFPELRVAFKKFSSKEDWAVIEKARLAGFSTAESHAADMMDIFERGEKKNDMEWTQNEIQKKLIEPNLS